VNRVLLEADEIGPDGLVQITGRRSRHMLEVLRTTSGSSVKIGVVNGDLGKGRVITIDKDTATLHVEIGETSPPPLFDLLLAVPRPKVLKRLLPQIAALGARRIALVNAFRVERAYFDSHWLREENFRPLLVEGLEQAGATQLPEVLVRRRFKPFVEDELDALLPGGARWVGHPGGSTAGERRHSAAGSVSRSSSNDLDAPLKAGLPVLAVGPEGGWTEFELGMLEERGFRRVSLGPRLLRTDTAVIALAAVHGVILAV
jgi:RsmE family RNA methyltransferase